MMVRAETAQLLVIDLQERLLPAIDGADRVLANTTILMQAADVLGLPITISEQYPRGLGPTASAIMDHADRARVLEKVHFSCQSDPAIAAHLAAAGGRRQLILCGTESHICVLQSALGLKQAGYDVYVVADAVSSRKSFSVDIALRRLEAGGVRVVTTEMVLFELMEKAGTDLFRNLSRLIK